MIRKSFLILILFNTTLLFSQETEIDRRSYNLGVIGAFSEVVSLDIKKIALSSAMAPGEMSALLDDARRIAKQNGVAVFLEKDFLVTDLFDEEITRDKMVLIIYKENTLLEYQNLKREKQTLLQKNRYSGSARRDIAVSMGKLLSYPDEKIEQLLLRDEHP